MQDENVPSQNIRTSGMEEPVGLALSRAQKSFAAHNKAHTALKDLLDKNREEFQAAFTFHLNKVLLVFKKEPGAERVLSFLSKFVAVTANDEAFAEYVLTYLLSRLGAQDKAVRYRSCQLLASMLATLPEEAEISEDVFEQIVEKVLPCARDKVAPVRLQAVAALVRMQDGEEREDEVLSEYLRLLATDSAQAVRAAVLQHIAISRETLPHVLKRARDAHADVRVATFDVVREKIPLRSLRISQRIQLLRDGLRDRVATVQAACLRLVAESWLPSTDDNLVKLLECLDVETYTEEAELLLGVLFQEGLDQGSNTPSPPLSADKLTAESSLYWRCLLDHCKKNSKEEELEKAMLDTVELCSFLKHVAMGGRVQDRAADGAEEQEQQEELRTSRIFIVQQLLQLAKYADVQDEVGRQELSALARELVCSLNCDSSVVSSALDIVHFMHKRAGQNESSFVQSVLELLADVRDPLEDGESESARGSRESLEARLAQLEEHINEVETSKLLAVQQEKYEAAAELQKTLRVAKSERAAVEGELGTALYQGSATWERLLTIASQLLQRTHAPLSALSGLSGLLDDTILPGLELPGLHLRLLATQCLGLFCLLDRIQAREQLSLLVKIMCNEVFEVQLQAVRSLFDLLLIYPDLLQANDSSAEDPAAGGRAATRALIEPLLQYLELKAYTNDRQATGSKKKKKSEKKSSKDGAGKVEVEDLRALCVEGFAKLLTLGRLGDDIAGVVLSKLLLLHFHPVTVQAPSVRQCLSVFFPTFVGADAMAGLPGQRRGLLRAEVIDLVKEITQARRGSALKQVDLTKLCHYLLFLLDDETTVPRDGKEQTPHERLGLDCLYYLLVRPSSTACEPLARTIAALNIRSEAQQTIKEMRFLLQQALEVVSDKAALRYLNKFGEALKQLDVDPTAELTAEARLVLEETIELQHAGRMAEEGARQGSVQAEKKGRSKVPIKAQAKKNKKSRGSDDSENSKTEESDEEYQPMRKQPAARPRARPQPKQTKVAKNLEAKSSEEETEAKTNKKGKHTEVKPKKAATAKDGPVRHVAASSDDSKLRCKHRKIDQVAGKEEAPEKTEDPEDKSNKKELQKQPEKSEYKQKKQRPRSSRKKRKPTKPQKSPEPQSQAAAASVKPARKKATKKKKAASGSDIENDQNGGANSSVNPQTPVEQPRGRPRRGAAMNANAKMKRMQQQEVEDEIHELLDSSSESEQDEPARDDQRLSSKQAKPKKAAKRPASKKNEKVTEGKKAAEGRAQKVKQVAQDIDDILGDSDEASEASDSEYVDE
eukprot:g28875.t1